jgi:zinc/manganese transport system substrate-binding protein
MRTILKTGTRRERRRVAGVVCCVVAGAGLVACSTGGGTAASSDHRVQVVAGENFWGSIATQIGGPDASVRSIIRNPDTDPHSYEATPADARTIASAKIVIENGIGYDPWVQQILDANGRAGVTVLNVGQMLGIAAGGNPHQWYSQAAVEKFGARLTSDLAAVDPAHRADYERNERSFETTGLAQYDALIARVKQQYGGTPIGASESIVTPLAETLGLRVMTPKSFLDAIAEGNEPTASDKTTADAQIRDHRIKVFVFNSQNSTPDVQRLVDEARREHIPVTAVTETLAPANVTFQAWQVRELRSLLAALARAAPA